MKTAGLLAVWVVSEALAGESSPLKVPQGACPNLPPGSSMQWVLAVGSSADAKAGGADGSSRICYAWPKNEVNEHTSFADTASQQISVQIGGQVGFEADPALISGKSKLGGKDVLWYAAPAFQAQGQFSRVVQSAREFPPIVRVIAAAQDDKSLEHLLEVAASMDFRQLH